MMASVNKEEEVKKEREVKMEEEVKKQEEDEGKNSFVVVWQKMLEEEKKADSYLEARIERKQRNFDQRMALEAEDMRRTARVWKFMREHGAW